MKIVILAAGKSTRFKSKKPKALHQLFGRTILDWVLKTAHSLNPSEIRLVLGHQAESFIEKLIRGESYAIQLEQKGTAHALMVALEELDEYEDGILVSCVDTPLLFADTLKKLIHSTKRSKSSVGVLTAELENPTGYGRIVESVGEGFEIVEDKDLKENQISINEINSGVYFFNLKVSELKELLSLISNENNQNEFYLTDIVKVANQKNLKITRHKTPNPKEIWGVNSRQDLALAYKIANETKIADLMACGVTFVSPESCTVSPDAVVGQDTTILPNTHIGSGVFIGDDCSIGPNTIIENSKIMSGCTVKSSSVVGAEIAENCSVGPFSNLRLGSKLSEGVGIGDFVELKNSTVGKNTKVSHLSYIGDAHLGDEVNVGAGTITANFDALNGQKNFTVVGNDVKVGSNSVLVAPVEIADGCMVGAGTIVTQSVRQKDSLIISRTPQVVKSDWVRIKREENLNEKAS
jgi:bifunctional UDP-N-acetylglucosamine pyrophosphorylase/glucosamine-1-phosphate N-acetyltransferase